MTDTSPRAATAPLPRTEARNPATEGLDALGSREILGLINDEDAAVAGAVRAALDDVARLVDLAVDALAVGGSIHYFGAGTSGRLAVLDAAELVPTFHLEPDRVVAHIAGGAQAVVNAVEGSEDSADAGAAEAAALGATDVAIGIAASGTTPYVRGALAEARRRGAVTALVTSNPGADLLDLVDVPIVADTGPEALTGSTRLKAGTAAKLVLNGFSTALMVRRGRAWSNLMVSLVATNAKLRDRSVRILVDATGLPRDEAARALAAADGEVKTALVAHLAAIAPADARTALAASDGSVRGALARSPLSTTPSAHDQ
jgi:N-acetylmuramic acid 6-phosphate etherase